MAPIRTGHRPGPARQRRRARRASAGQVHVYTVPNRLDEPNVVRWGLSAEQMFFVLVGSTAIAVLTAAALLLGLLVARVAGGGPTLWQAAPLLLLLAIRPLVWFATWRPDDLGPIEYLLLRLSTWRQPTHATWLPEDEHHAFAHVPPVEAPAHHPEDD